MYVPERVYNHLPEFWLGCAIASIFIGVNAILGSLMFAAICGTILTMRGKWHMAFLLLTFYFVFLMLVAASPKIGIW
jgi:hypothetical protein